jgi:enoyl-CoA hydratase
MPVIKNVYPSGICLVTISRPEALNALNNEIIGQLREVMEEIEQNNEVKGVIIIGDGEKAFVAGADIKELASLNQNQAEELARKGQSLFRDIENSPKPIIAAVNGFALGGGCELAMACHFRIASQQAKFGQPEINLGIIPGYGGTQRLTQLVGRGRALELLLTADMVSAEEAKSIGLVNHVVASREELLALSMKTMEKIISKSPITIKNIITAVNAGFGFEQSGYDQEAKLFGQCAATEDFKEGTTAFLEKRKPAFKNR